MGIHELIADLGDEQTALDRVVGTLEAGQWGLPTPAQGWTIAHQVAHLTYFDRAAAQAIGDPEAFTQGRDRLVAAVMEDPGAMDALTLEPYLAVEPAELLARWRAGRTELADAAAGLADADRVEWYGPSMSARSFLTARLMEVWAHGQDIIDALDEAGGSAGRPVTDRLRHIAHLGVVTRGWSYAVRGASAPAAEVRVELAAPGGGTWEWGPPDAADVVRGPAEDFCLVVTQRRHLDDTALAVTGEAATEWMGIAQAFAGGPTTARPRR